MKKSGSCTESEIARLQKKSNQLNRLPTKHDRGSKWVASSFLTLLMKLMPFLNQWKTSMVSYIQTQAPDDRFLTATKLLIKDTYRQYQYIRLHVLA